MSPVACAVADNSALRNRFLNTDRTASINGATFDLTVNLRTLAEGELETENIPLYRLVDRYTRRLKVPYDGHFSANNRQNPRPLRPAQFLKTYRPALIKFAGSFWRPSIRIS